MEVLKTFLLNENGELKFFSKLLLAGGLLIVSFLIVRVIQKVILKSIKKRFTSLHGPEGKRFQTLISLVESLTKTFILIIWFFASLSIFRIDAKGLVATAGIGGLAIGLAAKTFIEDFISGIFILAENVFNIGDYVSIAGKEGVVVDVALRITTIRDFNGELHTIPNNLIKIVTNRSKNIQRAMVEVPISYESDLARAKELLTKGLAEKFDGAKSVIEAPVLQAPVGLMDSGVLLRVVAYAVPGEQWRIEREMREEIKNILDRNNIEIPYNKMDINLKTEKNA